MGEPLRIGVAGLGVVGAGVLKVLRDSAGLADKRGLKVAPVAACARDRSRDRGVSLEGLEWFDDPVALARSENVDVFVELMGGADGPAKAATEAAIAAGKHVVTANKALIAEHGADLAAAAEAAGVALLYEAAVAGGLPAIRTVRDALAPCAIASVSGILNGTCNYILSEMEARGAAYADVLADAQRLGYAEADPSFDVGGVDAAHKLAILASLCFATRLSFSDVRVEGIEEITPLDVSFAKELGYRIKLIAAARMADDGALEQRVHPALVPLEHPLATVGDVFNAISIEAEPVGRLFMSGRGAGEGPTASAVAADLFDLAAGHARPPMGFAASELTPARALDGLDHVSGFYLRFLVSDTAGVIAALTEDLAEHDVSIDGIVQHASHAPDKAPHAVPVVITTHQCRERQIRTALQAISKRPFLTETPALIRIEEF